MIYITHNCKSKEEKLNAIKLLAKAVASCNRKAILAAANGVIDSGADLNEAIDNGLLHGIYEVERKYGRHEISIPHIMATEKTLCEVMDFFVSKMPIDKRPKPMGKIIIGIAQGDIHNIGKNLIRAVLKGRGYECIDLGEDVKPEDFVARAEEENAPLIAVGTLCIASQRYQKQVIDLLEARGLREKHRVVIGGRPDLITEQFAEEIGADARITSVDELTERIPRLMKKQDKDNAY